MIAPLQTQWVDDFPDDLLLYPDSDGKPMAENTEQYRWIVTIKENLELRFRDNADVFIAADLFWYSVERTVSPWVPPQAPDVMVVFGRPKGRRRSYRQWREAGIAPQVVFEILSPSNRTIRGRTEMQNKFAFYQTYGVEEYYLYDPDYFMLEAWLRQEEQLVPIALPEQWVSPRLGIRFVWRSGQELRLYHPDGSAFRTFLELGEALETSQQQALMAQQQALMAQQQVEQERQRAEQERQRAEQERQRAALQLRQIARSLRQQGMTLAQISQLTGLSADQLAELNLD